MGSGVTEAVSHPLALTQLFPFSGSASGFGGGHPEGLSKVRGGPPQVWNLAQGSLFPSPGALWPESPLIPSQAGERAFLGECGSPYIYSVIDHSVQSASGARMTLREGPLCTPVPLGMHLPQASVCTSLCVFLSKHVFPVGVVPWGRGISVGVPVYPFGKVYTHTDRCACP